MPDFNPRKDEDCAYLAAALTGYALGLRTDAILSRGRGTPIEARGRHIAIYLMHVGLGMSLARVARGFGRDRSTISYACQAIEDCREDGDFDIWIDQLVVGLGSVIILRDAPKVA